MIKVALNKKILHDYFIIERYEAGIVLFGSEVKSLRQGKISLQEAFVSEKDGQLWLLNAHIAPYDHAGHENHVPTRQRCLLLRRKEKNRLQALCQQRAMTIVPLAVYFNDRGFAKVTIALVKGKKLYDKRHDILRRSWERQKARLMKVHK